MDLTSMGIAGVAAITVICYLAGLAAKLAPAISDRVIPVVCGVCGLGIGLLWYFCGWAGFPASDPVTAAAVGIVSGLAATGVNQAVKQLGGGNGNG